MGVEVTAAMPKPWGNPKRSLCREGVNGITRYPLSLA